MDNISKYEITRLTKQCVNVKNGEQRIPIFERCLHSNNPINLLRIPHGIGSENGKFIEMLVNPFIVYTTKNPFPLNRLALKKIEIERKVDCVTKKHQLSLDLINVLTFSRIPIWYPKPKIKIHYHRHFVFAPIPFK